MRKATQKNGLGWERNRFIAIVFLFYFLVFSDIFIEDALQNLF